MTKKKTDYLDMTARELCAVISNEFPTIATAAAGEKPPAAFALWLAGYAATQPGTRAAGHLRTMLEAEGRSVHDLSTGEDVRLRTVEVFYNALRGQDGVAGVPRAGADMLLDILNLLREMAGHSAPHPSREKVKQYARRWRRGTDEDVVKLREANRERIIGLLVKRIEPRSAAANKRFYFPEGADKAQKRALVRTWWGDYRFHLAMAIRSPRELNRYLGYSLDRTVMRRLLEARRKGMPFFVTPYYVSLLDTTGSYDDQTIRRYVIYSQELVDIYGGIRAWEKEDQVVAGEPNAAGWLLPEGGNIHRRYPEVAILIPDSMGRACAGLCSPCQRMYGFQQDKLGFEFGALKPTGHWDAKLRRLMHFFRDDPELRDILITGGDALMSKNATLRGILDAVLRMASRKREARAAGADVATMDRIRLGTRILAYLPMRVNDELVEILRDVRRRGEQLGISQFVIQTHFESPLEITPEAREAIGRLLSAGWMVTNQLVFTAAASRRGHTARLRQELARQGVIPYYTFTVKGFSENRAMFAPNSRSLQEAAEEKAYGLLNPEAAQELTRLASRPALLRRTLPALLRRHDLPFPSTDRSVLNLPGIGKSMTFTTVGLTPDGRRILCFDHDRTRRHSPVIERIGKVYITENKSIAAYLHELRTIGENPAEYASIWQYRTGETEPRAAIYEYPEP
ncbi:MAG: KamA family protein [Rikenellaceae bacterium]|jgi:lysine 2,3-aminomutase|nr:KamA family protein [Rikenellaceae bacterium]